MSIAEAVSPTIDWALPHGSFRKARPWNPPERCKPEGHVPPDATVMEIAVTRIMGRVWMGRTTAARRIKDAMDAGNVSATHLLAEVVNAANSSTVRLDAVDLASPHDIAEVCRKLLAKYDSTRAIWLAVCNQSICLDASRNDSSPDDAIQDEPDIPGDDSGANDSRFRRGLSVALGLTGCLAVILAIAALTIANWVWAGKPVMLGL